MDATLGGPDKDDPRYARRHKRSIRIPIQKASGKASSSVGMDSLPAPPLPACVQIGKMGCVLGGGAKTVYENRSRLIVWPITVAGPGLGEAKATEAGVSGEHGPTPNWARPGPGSVAWLGRDELVEFGRSAAHTVLALHRSGVWRGRCGQCIRRKMDMVEAGRTVEERSAASEGVARARAGGGSMLCSKTRESFHSRYAVRPR